MNLAGSWSNSLTFADYFWRSRKKIAPHTVTEEQSACNTCAHSTRAHYRIVFLLHHTIQAPKMVKNMTLPNRLALLCMFAAFAAFVGHANPKPTWIDPAKAKAEDPDFSIQGEYGSDKPGATWGLQVIAMGGGNFDAYLLKDGLPGLGWERGKQRSKLKGKRDGQVTTLNGADGLSVKISANKAEVTVSGTTVSLPRIERQSETVGKKAPADAVVLFDGTGADAWDKGKMEGNLLVNNDVRTKQLFQSYHLHLEFRTPYKPFHRGQGRGNSGVYHQGRYETQVLDAFGLEGKQNETGGIYSIAAPQLNACLPPLTWQTYDVDFTTAEWKDGKKVKNASMTVRLNGIVIHENQELPKSTTASPVKESPAGGPIFLQHHGNPVRYRNVWIVPK
jgi:hypothetical protein